MRKWMPLLMGLMMCTLPSFACLNGFSELFGHYLIKSRKQFPVPLGHPVPIGKGSSFERSEWEQDYKSGRFEGTIDHGLALVYAKEYKEAEAVFQKAVEKWPGKYESAANYGTILEVNGKPAKALEWIRKSIAIDPNSHDGSEWIHVKILESKVAGTGTVSGSALTGVDFGSAAMPSTTMTKAELKKLQKELFWQLNERITFIEPEDPYIAALMMELGNVTLSLGDGKAAKEIYALARKYGMKGKLLDLRMTTAEKNPEPAADSTGSVATADTAAIMEPVDSQPVKVDTAQLAASMAPGVAAENGKGSNLPWVIAVLAAVAVLIGNRHHLVSPAELSTGFPKVAGQ